MKLKIIPNEQTPKTFEIDPDFIELFIEQKKELLLKFMKFARSRQNCAGLASNQVAVDGNRIQYPFFAIRQEISPNIYRWKLVINPKITKYIGEPIEKIEGCLTWLGKKIKAQRYYSVEVEYWGLKGEHFRHKISGVDAQICQHEYNHLMGVEEEFIEEKINE